HITILFHRLINKICRGDFSDIEDEFLTAVLNLDLHAVHGIFNRQHLSAFQRERRNLALYINMRHSLQGFRNFFLTEVAASSKESGLAELRRLEQSHYLLVHRTDHEAAARFMRTKEGFGRTGLTGLVAVSNTALLEKLIQTNTPEVFDAILIMAIPQRWFKKSQRKGDILSHIDSMLPVTKNGQRLP